MSNLVVIHLVCFEAYKTFLKIIGAASYEKPGVALVWMQYYVHRYVGQRHSFPCVCCDTFTKAEQVLLPGGTLPNHHVKNCAYQKDSQASGNALLGWL